MIISASRRTDLPTYYSDWFYNRIKEGYVLVRNPMNIHQVSRISLSLDLIDCIVLWTKNPIPMINGLEQIDKYSYYFQFTLNSYGYDVEPHIPSKNEIIIPAFQNLSKKIGKDRLVWRYDPILFNEKYTMDYHLKYFRLLTSKLSSYTEKCTVSFLDFYRNTQKNIKPLNVIKPSYNQKVDLLSEFSKIADEFGIYIDTCAEDIDLLNYGIGHAHCIDKDRIERICGYDITISKDTNQRPECGCVASIDIGAYNTCENGCIYCYANYSMNTVKKNYGSHNPKSALMIGELENSDVVKDREMYSCKNRQLNIFDGI